MDSVRDGGSELLDGRREHGDKVAHVLTGPTAGKPPGTGAVKKYWNRGRPRVASGHCCLSFLPVSALRDGFSHVLGLRIVVPEALRRLSGQLLRQRQYFVDLSILAFISRSLLCCFTRSVRELFARAALQFLRLDVAPRGRRP